MFCYLKYFFHFKTPTNGEFGSVHERLYRVGEQRKKEQDVEVRHVQLYLRNLQYYIHIIF